MTQTAKEGIYVYQPFGVNTHHGDRIYGVGGLPLATTCTGFTRTEAEAIVQALTPDQPVPDRVKRLARGFAAEWLRPDNPDSASSVLLDTLQTAMLAFFACASRLKLAAPAASEGQKS